MADSRMQCSLNPPMGECRIPARTCGSLGVLDQADPNVTSLLGDTPGPLGCDDYASVDLPRGTILDDPICGCRASDGVPLAPAVMEDASAPNRKPASGLSLSDDAMTLLKAVETLRLNPYDDQTSKVISSWVQGATIGYGHLIQKGDWDTYKAGIKEADADTLFASDLKPFVSSVQSSVTANVSQNEFDAMVILAYNIGPDSFSGSSVVKLVNDPKAVTQYADLEAAWKAWNKSEGKVMKGLDNRRQCEWDIYTKGIYKRW